MTDDKRAEDGAGSPHWKEQEECQGCGAPKAQIGQEGGVPLRAIKLKSGGRDLLCVECFCVALDEGRVDPTDPRVRSDGSANLGVPSAPGQRGGPRE